MSHDMDPAVLFNPEAHACSQYSVNIKQGLKKYYTLEQAERWTSAPSTPPPLTSKALAIGLTVIICKNPKPSGGDTPDFK